MMNPFFTDNIIQWYHKNKRDLPWRRTKDPYKIWLSEIILQQTRVSQGYDYYERFTERFPDVYTLAEAGEDEVLLYWKGLGYYSRARNLHRTAKAIVDDHEGVFPAEYNELCRLHGIGDYTASAVLSIAYKLPYVVVDGNVIRVLSRFYGISENMNSSAGKKTIKRRMMELLYRDAPGVFNQAVMEFGALQCIPVKPDCNNCILKANCHAFQRNNVKGLPVLLRRSTIRSRYFNYLVFLAGNNGKMFALLRKRTERDVWRGLYDFPCIEGDKLLEEEEIKKFSSPGKCVGNISYPPDYVSADFKHRLSHQLIHARFYVFNLPDSDFDPGRCKKIELQQLNTLAVPRLIEKFFEMTDYLRKI